MDPCQQTKAIDNINGKLDRVAEALQTLAVQKKEIQHLIAQLGELRDWVKGQERRLQAVEKRPGDSASRFVWLLAGGTISVVTAIVIGVMQRGM